MIAVFHGSRDDIHAAAMRATDGHSREGVVNTEYDPTFAFEFDRHGVPGCRVKGRNVRKTGSARVEIGIYYVSGLSPGGRAAQKENSFLEIDIGVIGYE